MSRFHDRGPELEALGRAFGGPEPSLFVLYGRRRLGKTTLLRRFAEGKPGVYHLADRSTEKDAIRLLARSMAVSLSDPALAEPTYPGFGELLTAYDRARPRGKSFLVLDEYQYLCEVQPALSSVLQRHWDLAWSRAPLMVVLCGSVLSMMYEQTLARSSPLYGRRTGQWLLEPMRFRDVAAFHPGLDPVELVRMWSLSGGVPRYAEVAAQRRNLATALRHAVLAKDGPLYAEARFLLQDEVTTPNVYWSILAAVASGAKRISEIAGRVGLGANQLTRYLAALSEMGLVRRHVSVTEPRPERSKRGLHQLDDAFLRLWFGCVAPYQSLLELGQVRRVEELMRERLARHVAWAFEVACRQHVEDRLEEVGAVRVGRFWSSSAEVDVVAVGAEGEVVLAGECNWSPRRASAAAGKELAAKVERLWPERADRVRLALFSAGGFAEPARAWARDRGAWLVSAGDLAA